MRRDALSERYELFVAAGTLAAHATHLEQGFRQREAKFFAELFSNWMDSTLPTAVLELKNTQVKRYLESLLADGFAKQRSRKAPPRYELTRGGIIELLNRLRHTETWPHPAHFFFILFFFSAYGPVILELLDKQEKKLPPQFRAELVHLLDPEALCKEQLNKIAKKSAALSARAHDAALSAVKAQKAIAQGQSPTDVFTLIEDEHAYPLNSQRPLHSLLNSLSPDHALWELTTGTEMRNELMWQPLMGLMRLYSRLVENLRRFHNK